MQFVIKGMKYNTDNMENVAKVKKWYQIDNIWTRAAYPGKEVGRVYECELWKSEKGNWLLTHEVDYSKAMGEAIPQRVFAYSRMTSTISFSASGGIMTGKPIRSLTRTSST